MDSQDGQNPVLDIGGSQQKVAGSVFPGGGSQITGGGSESWGGELRSGGMPPPNLTPGLKSQYNINGHVKLNMVMISEVFWLCTPKSNNFFRRPLNMQTTEVGAFLRHCLSFEDIVLWCISLCAAAEKDHSSRKKRPNRPEEMKIIITLYEAQRGTGIMKSRTTRTRKQVTGSRHHQLKTSTNISRTNHVIVIFTIKNWSERHDDYPEREDMQFAYTLKYDASVKFQHSKLDKTFVYPVLL